MITTPAVLFLSYFFAVIERVCHCNSVIVAFPLKQSTHGELIYFSVMPQGTKSGKKTETIHKAV